MCEVSPWAHLPADMVRVIASISGVIASGSMKRVCKAWSRCLLGRRAAVRAALSHCRITSSDILSVKEIIRVPDFWEDECMYATRARLNSIICTAGVGGRSDKMPCRVIKSSSGVNPVALVKAAREIVIVQNKHREKIMAYSARARVKKWFLVTEDSLLSHVTSRTKDYAVRTILRLCEYAERNGIKGRGDFTILWMYYSAWAALALLRVRIQSFFCPEMHREMWCRSSILFTMMNVLVGAHDIHSALCDVWNNLEKYSFKDAPAKPLLYRLVTPGFHQRACILASTGIRIPSPFNDVSVYDRLP